MRLTASNTRSEPDGVVGARHDGLAAGGPNRSQDLLRVGRDDHAAGLGRHGAAPHVHDHRLAIDIGQRLAGQPGRLHARGNDDQGLRHGRPLEIGWIVPSVTIGLGARL